MGAVFVALLLWSRRQDAVVGAGCAGLEPVCLQCSFLFMFTCGCITFLTLLDSDVAIDRAELRVSASEQGGAVTSITVQACSHLCCSPGMCYLRGVCRLWPGQFI